VELTQEEEGLDKSRRLGSEVGSRAESFIPEVAKCTGGSIAYRASWAGHKGETLCWCK
jgi:hypothetical protein